MDARKALQELADEVYAEIIRRLHSRIGVHDKVGKNTLIGSNLEESIKLYPADDDSIVFQIASYFSYITNGRHHGMKPPFVGTLEAIFNWVTRKHITLDNKDKGSSKITDPNVVATKVYYALKHKRDLPPREFLGPGGYDYDYNQDASEVITFLDEFVEDWMDDLYNDLINSI